MKSYNVSIRQIISRCFKNKIEGSESANDKLGTVYAHYRQATSKLSYDRRIGSTFPGGIILIPTEPHREYE